MVAARTPGGRGRHRRRRAQRRRRRGESCRRRRYSSWRRTEVAPPSGRRCAPANLKRERGKWIYMRRVRISSSSHTELL